VLPGLGRFGHHRRRRRKQEIRTRPFQLVTGRVWKGTAFGARGVPMSPRSTGTWMARSNRRLDHARTAARSDQRGSSSCMRANRSGRSSY
jgi:hypothetical protein